VASTYQLVLDGAPADEALYGGIASLEVEENADLPGAIQLVLPVDTTAEGDLTWVSDPRVKPFANLAVVATLEGGSPECLFDGYVLSHKLHLERGATASTLRVWGQDASWLMNLDEKVKEWVDVTDGAVANAIFSDYGISPAPENTDEDSPSHPESGHTLMQRGSDIQFLRSLARRNGKLCRVACADAPGARIGYFARPNLEGEPVATLKLNDPEAPNVETLEFEWDVTRPTAVRARQALFNEAAEDGIGGESADGGLPLLEERGLAAFSGRPMTVLLTAPVDDAGELQFRRESLLREAAWFVRCEGETEASRLNAVLRVGSVVAVDGVGSLFSGKYYVWSVRHTLLADAHRMRFTLVRNAAGPEPQGGGGLLGGLL